jgi:hypothetical protein
MPQMRVEDFDPSDSTLTASFDPGCNTADNNVYFGPLEDVSSYGFSGQVCNVGMSGTTEFRLPRNSYFFVIVGDDDSVEGSYGADSTRTERPTWGSCGFVQDLSNSCVQE